MVTASRMQNMVQIRKKNTYFVTNKFFRFFIFTFRALGVESPRGGAMTVSASPTPSTMMIFPILPLSALIRDSKPIVVITWI